MGRRYTVERYKEVYDKMSQNKEERASRGGNATKQKYLSLKQGRL